jgi:hypothetical protein
MSKFGFVASGELDVKYRIREFLGTFLQFLLSCASKQALEFFVSPAQTQIISAHLVSHHVILLLLSQLHVFAD